MKPYLDDGDVRLYHGDVRAVLAELPDASVDCVVTSPPYWQLRDYAGMATWEGGDPGCDHLGPPKRTQAGFNERYFGKPFDADKQGDLREPMRGDCPCGAVRHDHQIGLEPTIEEYVAALVGVFAQVRRVLAPWGTCWLNLGDSYAGNAKRGGGDPTIGERNIGGSSYPIPSVPDGLKPKDLCMVPARVALALQADGWWLRSRVIWAKPNPMPESVTDRPTSAHEEIFLLTRAPTYYYDAEAVREAQSEASLADHLRRKPSERSNGVAPDRGTGDQGLRENGVMTSGSRNLRNVWSIATEPTPEAHFATFPLELVRRCLAAGCPVRVCRECGEPSRRVVERKHYGDLIGDGTGRMSSGFTRNAYTGGDAYYEGYEPPKTTGWTDCGHDAYRPGIVLDPFVGSGKTAQQARRMGLHAVGIDGSAEYLGIAAKRLQQLSLLS